MKLFELHIMSLELKVLIPDQKWYLENVKGLKTLEALDITVTMKLAVGWSPTQRSLLMPIT
uniref:Uncharacterized protein n=1 Tax=Arundo donax TaxID=35708 RepID=A0A0A9CCD8_ARUDO